MEVAAVARPQSHVRPTQAYYVPRKKLECMGGRQTSPDKIEEKKSSPPATSPNGTKQSSPKTERSQPSQPQMKGRRSPGAFEPKPLMSEMISKPENLKEKPHRQQQQKKKSLPITTSSPRVVPSKSPIPLVRPNGFSAAVDGPSDECICHRPDGLVGCRRCGYEEKGRVQLVCQVHPMKMSLMDVRECPNPICRSIQIIEIPIQNNH